MRSTSLLPLFAGAASLVLTFAAPAPAAFGTLDTPDVPFAPDYPAAARAKVQHALNRPDCKFLGGSWLNSWTSLRYRGDTLALNQLIDELVKCPGVTVHVGLKRFPDEADWRVGHAFHQNRFQVEVNLDSKRVELENLYIPEFKGPVLGK